MEKIHRLTFIAQLLLASPALADLNTVSHTPPATSVGGTFVSLRPTAKSVGLGKSTLIKVVGNRAEFLRANPFSETAQSLGTVELPESHSPRAELKINAATPPANPAELRAQLQAERMY